MSKKSRDVLLIEITVEFFKTTGWTPQKWDTFQRFVVDHPKTPKERGLAKTPDGSIRRDVNGKTIEVLTPVWGDTSALRTNCSRLFAEPGLPRTKADGTVGVTLGGIVARQGGQQAKLAAKYRDLIAPPEGVSRGKSPSPPAEVDWSVIPD